MNASSATDIRNSTVELCCDLVKRDSVTPADKGCQTMLAERLAGHGFSIEPLPFEDVDNLWARRGKEDPLLVFAGHTDVVPVGDPAHWKHDPFGAVIEGDLLYGRGAADMKGGLAAMVTAAERFVQNHPGHKGSIGFLLTSDEEGPAVNGTRKVVEVLQNRSEKITWCIIGEPSSSQQLGDTVRNGRRGSLGATLTVAGKQGHVAYPQLADNPVHKALAAIDALTKHEWDAGNAFFPATTLQISNINAGTGATNVIPAEMTVNFNLRFSTELNAEKIQATASEIIQSHGLRENTDYSIAWNLSGVPFVTSEGELTGATIAAITANCGISPQLDTGGGTSDGRFIAPTGAQTLELGPCNATIHSIDENVSCEELGLLSATYENILERLLLT